MHILQINISKKREFKPGLVRIIIKCDDGYKGYSNPTRDKGCYIRKNSHICALPSPKL